MSTPSSNTSCHMCQRSFSRPENLARHVRGVHTNEAQYQCPQCQKRFTRSDLLRKHRKIHARSSTVDSFEQDIVRIEQDDHHNVPPPDTPRPQALSRDLTDRYHVGTADSELLNVDHRVPPLPPACDPLVQFSTTDNAPDGDAPWYCGPSYGEGMLDVDLAWTFDYIMPDQHETGHHANLPYMPQVYTTAHIGEGQTVASTSTHESRSSDWPDGQSRSASPLRELSNPSYSDSCYVNTAEIEQTLQENKIVLANTSSISPNTTRQMFEVVASQQLRGFCGRQPHVEEFPGSHILQHFLLLYFVHVHPRFPITHLPTFSPDLCFPDMLLAMILAGSCHSESNQYAFCHAYIERARMSATLQRERSGSHLKVADHLFTLLLLSQTATWSGQTEAYRRAETDRGVLISACRRSRLLDCRSGQHENSKQYNIHGTGRGRLNDSWLRWVDAERRKRLGLSIYTFDCQFAALLQRQPYISKAETTNTALPCDSVFWEAPTAQAWKLSLGPAETPPSIYHLPTLSSILLGKELMDTMYFPPLDSSSRLFYIYVVHTHIFEWRQAVCMLNSTGLRDTPVSLSPEQIGEGLIDRQRWLLGALETWSETYGRVPTIDLRSTAQQMGGQLLYHLGHLALSINFADLYVVAGRTGSREDISLAAESIRNRLSADKSYKILDHAFQMLEVALDVVQTPAAQQCSHELAVCLFMGGLTCWAVSNVPQQPDLDACLVWLRQHHHIGERRLSQGPVATSERHLVLVETTQRVIVALKSLRFLGFASIFASVLEKLSCDDP